MRKLDEFVTIEKAILNRMTSLEREVAALRGEDALSPSTPRTVAHEEEGQQEEEEGIEFKMPAETEEEFLLNDNQLADPRTRRLVVSIKCYNQA